MFTGIIQALGTVTGVQHNGSNITFTLSSAISAAFRPDESISHNGVCLTITHSSPGSHTVTAIGETLAKTNLGTWQQGTQVNLEQAMQLSSRVDGHLVQGHVDCTALCTAAISHSGSTEFRFSFPPQHAGLVIEKGSICINGVSLTLVNVTETHFSVHIIPYTMQHTNFNLLQPGHTVNVEFDIIGKYIMRNLSLHGKIIDNANK